MTGGWERGGRERPNEKTGARAGRPASFPPAYGAVTPSSLGRSVPFTLLDAIAADFVPRHGAAAGTATAHALDRPFGPRLAAAAATLAAAPPSAGPSKVASVQRAVDGVKAVMVDNIEKVRDGGRGKGGGAEERKKKRGPNPDPNPSVAGPGARRAHRAPGRQDGRPARRGGPVSGVGAGAATEDVVERAPRAARWRDAARRLALHARPHPSTTLHHQNVKVKLILALAVAALVGVAVAVAKA